MATLAESHADAAERLVLQEGDVLELASGTYRVRQQLGEGGFGIVHEVAGPQGGLYAFKVLKLWEIMPRDQPELADRFVREYQAGRIDSPYIVRSLYDGQVNGNPYIVMDFCPGGSLSRSGFHSKGTAGATICCLHPYFRSRACSMNLA